MWKWLSVGLYFLVNFVLRLMIKNEKVENMVDKRFGIKGWMLE